MIVTRYKKLTLLFVAFAATYLLLTALLPVDKAVLAKYRITRAQDIGLSLTVTVPYVIIWFIALIGYLRLRTYTEKIKSSKDGMAFQRISGGLFWLALWLPLSTILNTITTAYANAHHGAAPAMVIINNYANIVMLMPIFAVIESGSLKLLGAIKKTPSRLPQSLIFLFIAFGSLYQFLTLADANRQFPSHNVTVAAYYLPDWLIVFTVIIPRLFTWFLGMKAVYNLYLYKTAVKGQIYREGLNRLAGGIAGVIISLIVLRCFQSLSSQLTELSLGLILLVVYALLVIISVGYIFIAKGARSLQRIEEI